MRSFIALDFNDEIKNNVNRYVERWRHQAAEVKWVRSHGLHLTLKFLGEIDDGALSAARLAVEAAAAHHSPFLIRLKGTGSFPTRSRSPRVLWIGLETTPALSALHADMEVELEQRGFPRETHAFHPHLTIGRVRRPPLPEKMIEEFHQGHETTFGEMLLRKITIFKSVLMKSGAEYSPLAEINLS